MISNRLPNHHEITAKADDNAATGRELVGPLRGVIVPLVTPLESRDELDVDGLSRLVEHVIAGGVHGIFLLGTTGEAAALSGRVRRELVSRVCCQVGGRVPVLVGISDTSMVESLSLANDAAQCGASAVVLTTPYYLPLEPLELVSYIQTISAESPLPLFLYNMPELARTWYTTEVLSELLDLENVVGLKDSSGDEAYFSAAKSVLSRRPDWSLLMGSESMMAAAIRSGAHGCVTGGANVFPRLFAEIYAAAVENDEGRLATLQQQVVELSQIYCFGGYAVGSIRGIKSALKQMSITSDKMAAPFFRVNEVEQAAIAACLRRLGLLSGSSPKGHGTMRIDEPGHSRRIYGSAPISTSKNRFEKK